MYNTQEQKRLETKNTNLTSKENQFNRENMITRKKTIARVNNFTKLPLETINKKQEIRLLTEEENRVANFLKQKLESTVINEKISFTNIGSLDNAVINYESECSELSKDEKEYNPGTLTNNNRAPSRVQLEKKNTYLNLRSNINRIHLSSQNLNIYDRKSKYWPSIKSHKTMALQDRIHQSGELIDMDNKNYEASTEKKSRKSSFFIKSTIKSKKLSDDKKNITLKTKKYSLESLPKIINIKDIKQNSPKILSTFENVDNENTNQNFKLSNISEVGQIEKNILISDNNIIITNSDFKISEKKIELGDSEESINIEDGNIENIEEIKEELKSNLRLNIIQELQDSALRSEFEDFEKQKERKYRILTHKNLIYDSSLDEDSETEIINIIHPDSTFLSFFNFLVYLAGCYSIIFTPIYLAYFYASPSNFLNFFFIMENFIEIIFIADVVINFFTGFYDREEKLIISKNKIGKNYIKSWMTIDVLSALPTHSILFTIKILNNENENYIPRINLLKNYNYSYVWIILILRLFKLLKIIKANKFTEYIVKNLFEEFNATLYRVLQFLVYFSVMTHCLACIFIYVGTLSHPNWMLDQHLLDTTSSEIYLASIYFIMTTLFTIGYGDIKSIHLNERLYNIFILMFGVLIYSYAVSSLGNFFLEKTSKEKVFEANMQCLEGINYKYTLKPKLYKKIVKYLKFKSKTNKNEETALLNELPTSLKNEMILRIYNPIIKDFVFFRNVVNASKDFTVRVVMSLKPVTAVRNDRLINEGEFMEEMIFVKHGILSLEVGIKVILKKYLKQFFNLKTEDPNKLDISKDISSMFKRNKFEDFTDNFNKPDKNNKFFKTLYLKLIQLRNNEHFGDILMFLNKRSPLSVRVKSRTAQLFTMNKTDMVSISLSYPQIFEKICKRGAFNQKQLEILILKTKYLFYMNNKKQFIGDDFIYKNDDEDKFSHYYINTLDEEEMKRFINFNVTLKSIPSTRKIEEESLNSEDVNMDNRIKTHQSLINYNQNKNGSNKSISIEISNKTIKNSGKKISLPLNNSNTNHNINNSYKEFYDRVNCKIDDINRNKSNEEPNKLESIGAKMANHQMKIGPSDSNYLSSSNSTISEKTNSEEEEESKEVVLRNNSLKLGNINLNRKPTFGIQDKTSQMSGETHQFKSNFNQQKFYEGVLKNFTDEKFEDLEVNNNNRILSDFNHNQIKYIKTISSDIFNNIINLQNSGNEVFNPNNLERKNTIFSEFQRIKENNLDMVINQELSSDRSRERDKVKNIEIKQMVPFYSEKFPVNNQNDKCTHKNNIFGNIDQNKNIFGQDFKQVFPYIFLTDESKKNSLSDNSTEKNSNLLENKILCNININNNINFNDNVFMQAFHSNCPNCNSTIFPISPNRVLLVFPPHKGSQIKETISWTNLNISHNNSFGFYPQKNFVSITTIENINSKNIPDNTFNKSASMSIIRPNSFRKLGEDIVNTKFPKSRPESNDSLNGYSKKETAINPLLVKNNISIINRKNSIDLLHQFKNTLFDQGKLKLLNKQQETLVDTLKNPGNINDNTLIDNNNNVRINDRKFPTKNLLSVVYKNIQENSMNLNEPKSFYSNLLMEVLDEKHKNIYMMKSLVDRLKGIREIIVTNSKTKYKNLKIDKDIA